MRTYLLFFFILAGLQLQAQTKLSGKISDTKGQAIPGVNVYIKDSYDGATTDANGNYSFVTDTGDVVLVISMIGYIPLEDKVKIKGESMTYNASLMESINEMKVVVISAGTIEASDEKRMTVLKPLDIVTTANSAGDIYGALKTLPGTQQVGESEGLFVRGGTGAETKTLIDGMVVNNPFSSGVPDIASRGRFSPFLFKGTVFSTGGYSAQYGQALSSALVLETQDLPDQSSSTVAVSVVGVGAGHNQLFRNNKASAGADLNYSNLAPYYALVNENVDWDRLPEAWGGSANFRIKTSSTGMLKFYGYNNYSRLAIYRDNLDSIDKQDHFSLKNGNLYTNATWKESIGEKWRVYLGTSYSNNRDDIMLNKRDTVLNLNELSQGKAMLTRYLGRLSQLRVGGEYLYSYDRSDFNHFSKKLRDNFTAAFTEADIYLSTKLVARLGGRLEHSSLMDEINIAPRASLAYKLGDFSQVSFAAGQFYQKPEREFLTQNTDLTYEKATHYILNLQKIDDLRTIRVEGYYKKYDDLTKTVLADTNNLGGGYAQGIDFFMRDKKTLKNVDYWLSYSYLDTKRNFRNYPFTVMPSFASKHTASIVFKRFFPKITSSAGFAYTYASGRPYFNPNNSDFLGDRTKAFHNLGVNYSYLTKFRGAFTVIAVAVGNVLGIENVFSYRYSSDGLRRAPVIASSNRSIFVGVFMSFGVDRRNEVNNN
jgi:hypothetical protein